MLRSIGEAMQSTSDWIGDYFDEIWMTLCAITGFVGIIFIILGFYTAGSIIGISSLFVLLLAIIWNE